MVSDRQGSGHQSGMTPPISLLLAKQGLFLRKLSDHPLDLLQIIFSAARWFFILSRLL